MTSASEPKWVLKIPFITAPGFPLKESHTVTLGGLQAEVRPTSFDYTQITIDGIESARAAYDLFEAMRIGMLVASLNIDWGIRVPSNVLTLEFDSPMPNQPDVPLIYPKGKNLSRLVVHAHVVQISPDKVLPKLLESLEIGLSLESARRAMSDDRVKLAVELYIDSYFETSDSARFIGLVGVLEVLKDKDPSSDAAKALIDKWRQEAGTLAHEEANSIQSSIAYLKSISISRGIGSVVKRHLGQDRMKEARDLYTARSNLVHDGIRPTDSTDTARRTQQIVRELLAHILMIGSR
jgi:Apea-like HEPN